MPEKKKKVVAYCRVSTLEQKKRGYGIDIQIRDASLYAERLGLLVERFYKDEGESGIKEDRKDLKRLLQKCRAGKIGVVILPSLDRLSREVRIAENLFYEFKKLGIKILIADMPQYNGEQKDILIRQILEAISEENRREIIERLWKGRQERVRRGLFPGGNLPYGYQRNGKGVLINHNEADIIRTIYARASQGMTGQEVADQLNNMGFNMRNGKPWTQRQISRILHRDNLYRRGMVRYGKESGQNHHLILLNGSEPATD